MKLVESILFKDLPSDIQDYIEAQYSYDKLEDKEIKKIKKELTRQVIELYEYDPNTAEDFSVLQDFLKQKIDDEGQPDMNAVTQIGNSGNIEVPILIENGICLEGRHRLQASLDYNLSIRAYVW